MTMEKAIILAISKGQLTAGGGGHRRLRRERYSSSGDRIEGFAFKKYDAGYLALIDLNFRGGFVKSKLSTMFAARRSV